MSSKVSEDSSPPRSSTFEPSSFVELLRGRALSRPGRRAYVFLPDGEADEVGLTFGELERRARAIGAWLQNAGAGGERVMLLYPPGLEYIAAFFGCLYAGAVAVPVYPPRRSQGLSRLQSILKDSRPSVVLTTSTGLSRGAAVLEEVSPLGNLRHVATDTLGDELACEWRDPEVCGETLAFLQYTSGSTSEPKGVMVSHANLLHNARMMQRACDHTEDSTFVSWLPLYHDMGLIGNVLQSLYFGATCVLMPPPAFLQRPLRWLHAISHYKAHTSGGPNFAYDLCVRRATPEDIATLDLSSWQAAFNGSEPIRHDSLERFAETFAPCGFRREAFFPCYGLAEATLFVSGGPKKSAPVIRPTRSSELKRNRVVEGESDDVRMLVGCGQTLAGQKVVVTNPETLIPCPPGEVGEVWLSGPSVTRGYWNKPEETEQSFRARHADTGDGPYLRTGDLGFIKDGELFITGRLKDLIIVRGLNHYPQDIEQTVEECHTALRPGCGAAFSVEAEGGERVVVVQEVVPRRKGLDLQAVDGAIREAVALGHELQLYAVVLLAAGGIPKTSSGKIRRRACRALFLEGALDVLNESRLEQGAASAPGFDVSAEAVVSAPPGEREELLESWLEDYVGRLLRVGRERLERHQSLTQLGLDSLAAVELSADVSEKFGAEVSPAELLCGPSIAEVADRILRALAADEGRGGRVERGDGSRRVKPARRDDPLPLSSTQQGLWFLSQLAKGSAFYNIPVAVRLSGPLNLRALEQSLSAIVSRHESLRTRFVTVAGRPAQVVMPPRPLTPEVVEVSGSDESSREAELLRLAGQAARRPFDLSEERLVRATLFRLGENECVLLILIHHIVADGWSVGVLMRELTELYDAYSEGSPASLPELKIQYADYVMWQRELLESEEVKRQLTYWKRQLGGDIPVLELPSEQARPAAASHRGATERFHISREVAEKLKALARQEGATLFMLMTAALNALLHRYTGQEQIVVGTPVANRTRREFEPLIGCFVNTLALRMTVSGDETFANFLSACRQVMLDAYANQDLPFEKLVEELQPDRSLSHTPIFQVMIASQNAPRRATKMGGLTLNRIEVETGTAKFDLLVFVEECEQGLECSFEYSEDVLGGGGAARMAAHYRSLLSAVVSDPSRPLRDLPLLTPAEEDELVRGWNQTSAPAEGPRLVHRLFEEAAAREPGSAAVAWGGGVLSYGELNERANRVARALRREGVGAESLVGVCAGRGWGLVAGALGVLKAGGAYVPLDAGYPRERLAYMLDDSRVSVLLTERALVGKLPRTDARVICLDADWPDIAEESGDNLDVDVSAHNLAYVIYTSGSTGSPKGVAIEHHSTAALLHWARTVYTPEELSGVLVSTSICFDLSVFEIFLPLSCGGKIILAENALQLPALPNAAEVKLINTVPSAMGELVSMKAVPPSVVTVNLAGEPLSGAQARQVLGETGARKLYNLYGPTECTTYSTFALVGGGAGETPNIGGPIDNTQVYILDRRLRPVPVGVGGELYISGEGVARGYLNRPRATAEKFIPDPFADAPGRRMYKTGDLARYLSGGRIDFLGRLDHQVKVRGFRIEPGEVQSALLQHPALKDVLVKDYGEGAGRQLVAYVVGGRQEVPGAVELRRFLAERLPDFMIPSLFVALEKMPLTPNGKIDRRALPPPDVAARGAGAAHVAPRSDTEELLASVWADLLGLRRVGVFDNFFDLGGHSLLATQLVSRLREAFGVEVPLRTLFSSLTVAELASEVESLRRGRQGARLPPVVRAAREDRPPLSFAQQRLWLLDQFEPCNPFYNISGGVRLEGPLRADALRRSINEIVSRHEALRTCFASHGGRPFQSVADEVSLALPVVDLSRLNEQARAREAAHIAREDARRPFDLRRAPLLRVSLVRHAEQEHVLLLTAHHIVFDGRSIELLVKELRVLYEAFRDGGVSPLAELPIQYVDYACWQRRWLAGELLEAQLSYWKERLGGDLPVLELPSDRPRAPVQTFRGDKQRISLDGELLDSLRSLGNRHGATMFMTLLAAFKVLLHRYTGQRDVLVGSPVSNRNTLETEPLIGFFVNTLVLRTDVSGRMSFGDLLGAVRETALDAYANQDVPFEKLVEELQPERDMSHTPIFQVMFSLRRSTERALELHGLSLTRFEVDGGTAKFDLALQLEETAEAITGYFEYSEDVLGGGGAARMAAHYRSLLSAAASDPSRPLRDLPLLTPAEEDELVRGWNRTSAPAAGPRLVHRLFEEAAAREPESAAVAWGGGELSYGELNERANRVARALRREGVGAESLVGVCAGRGWGLVAGALGALKAGGAYVPLDAGYPRERLAYMLDDSRVSVLLSERKLADRLPDHSGKTLFLDDIVAGPESDENVDAEVGPENLAYVIYTSGSTGRPKGVALRHAGLVNLIDWHRRVYELSPSDRATHLAGLEFDASVWELWPYLAAGASIHIPDEETRLSPSKLVAWLAREAVTVCFLPTPLAEAALRETWPSGTSLRALLTGGDKLQHRPGESLPFRLFNHYGPTESTVVATAGAVETESTSGRIPDIGRPISNVRVYLLDPHLCVVPVGVPGELCIGGEGLARGYLGRPALTSEKFIPDPFADEPGRRLYKTGDLARHLPDGSIEFLGRSDDQVKVRGFRVELAGIEAVLCGHEAVREAVVLAREEELGGKSLVAYVTAAPGGVLADDVLREHLKRSLPEYMIPPVFVTLDRMPLTPNGKVDRKALPAPSRVAPDAPRPAAGGIAEETLAAVWAEVLGGEQPGGDDNFFELGGHSIRAAQVLSRVREVFEVDLPLRSLFESPTVGGLYKLIERARLGEARRQSPPLRPAPRDADLPLSFAQERLWFLHRLQPESPAYNISGAVHIGGKIDPPVIEWSTNEIIRRHESLRTTFQTARGRPVQVVAPLLRLSLPVVDLSALPRAESGAEVQRLALEEALRPFDLTRGPLLRSTLILLGGDERVLLLTIHHIVSDGWSVRVFVREQGALWESFAAGKPSPLAELPLQYADFAHWQRQWLEGEALQTGLDFWKGQLAGAPPALELPTDHPRPPVQTLRGGRHHFGLSEDLSRGVRELSRGSGVTAFMTFNAALHVLLRHHTKRDDIVVGADIAERDAPELEGLIGLFVNQLVLRVGSAGLNTFGELLGRVRGVTLAAYDHRRVPFDKIVEAVRPEHDLSRNPLFQVMLVYESDPAVALRPAGLSVSLLQTDAGGSPFDISLTISEGPDGFGGALRYSTDLFEPATIARMSEQFETILRAVVARPDVELRELLEALARSDEELLVEQARALRDARSRMFGRVRPRAV
jgi:amino acid adenylation domain-containing protein